MVFRLHLIWRWVDQKGGSERGEKMQWKGPRPLPYGLALCGMPLSQMIQQAPQPHILYWGQVRTAVRPVQYTHLSNVCRIWCCLVDMHEHPLKRYNLESSIYYTKISNYFYILAWNTDSSDHNRLYVSTAWCFIPDTSERTEVNTCFWTQVT